VNVRVKLGRFAGETLAAATLAAAKGLIGMEGECLGSDFELRDLGRCAGEFVERVGGSIAIAEVSRGEKCSSRGAGGSREVAQRYLGKRVWGDGWAFAGGVWG
jgi:hypothetical protein